MSRLKNLRRRLSVLTASACCMMLPSAVTLGGEGTTRSLSSGGINYAPSTVTRSLNSNQGPSLTRDSLEFETASPPMATRGGYPVSTQMVDPMVAQPQPQPMQFEQPNYQVGSGNSMPADCCMGCDRSFYAIYDSLWVQRTGDDGFTLAAGKTNRDFNFDWAGRYTLGQMFDCTDGVEVVYTGQLDWQVGGPKNPPSIPSSGFTYGGGGFATAAAVIFNNSVEQIDLWKATFQSAEFNRRWFASDVLSSLVGVRAISYDEQYFFQSRYNAAPTAVATYDNRITNLLVGGQIGMDLSFPLSQRLSSGTRARAGIYSNYNRGLTNVNISFPGVVQVVDNRSKDIDLAGMIEFGTSLRYRIVDRAVLTAGYETWYMPGVGTAPHQRMLDLNINTGRKVHTGGDVFFHGATAGLEVSF